MKSSFGSAQRHIAWDIKSIYNTFLDSTMDKLALSEGERKLILVACMRRYQ